MNLIIYIDGRLADDLGQNTMMRFLQELANKADKPIDLLTHGESAFHGSKRYTAEPISKNSSNRVFDQVDFSDMPF